MPPRPPNWPSTRRTWQKRQSNSSSRAASYRSTRAARKSDATVSAALGAQGTGRPVLHYKHERLAVVVAADNARPSNRGEAPYRFADFQGDAEKRRPRQGC
ncbi:hypothetical protein ABZ890_10230 [Streptomyces sp. NPDC046984]|uniref:hypothetical protein n=1 Tax=Streptomyces sp. NPDC046984 TaxID=3155138 RepID=UPI0033DCA0DE